MILGRVGGGRSGEWEEWGVGGVGSGRSGRSGEWVPTPHSLGGETAIVSSSRFFIHITQNAFYSAMPNNGYR